MADTELHINIAGILFHKTGMRPKRDDIEAQKKLFLATTSKTLSMEKYLDYVMLKDLANFFESKLILKSKEKKEKELNSFDGRKNILGEIVKVKCHKKGKTEDKYSVPVYSMPRTRATKLLMFA